MRIYGARIIAAIAAAAIAMGAAGYANAQPSGAPPVETIAANPSVATSSFRNRSDAELVREVRRALNRTPNLPASGIHVQSHQAVVTLTGWVPHRSQVQRATNAARSVRGVRRVQNRLNVRTRGGSGH
ncbi:BON domain-containing protein [Paraburkholderia sp. MMS20-SJTR3]|uniref:BON domain-containing protein n=1 Tax=Paraburkholderia sejongensis TaxID=2886946 RepID=A0ABS8K1G6_9BURK|nr:BON domain-containing protein [Paraburkholderia sp. MMS20-SJTR3]MCC8396004.1 BON domain-containing protein [Paraburkholderia sp. MMS20-SJTR3]